MVRRAWKQQPSHDTGADLRRIHRILIWAPRGAVAQMTNKEMALQLYRCWHWAESGYQQLHLDVTWESLEPDVQKRWLIMAQRACELIDQAAVETTDRYLARER